MSDGAVWWWPGGCRTWTCGTCGHHSIADALGACPSCETARLAPQPEEAAAAPRPRARAPRSKPAARTGARTAKGG